ncbi:F-box/FBD/LRR-repeat protein At1g13570 [Linum grandiflorum]
MMAIEEEAISSSASADRISSLPDEIRHHVLNFLPLKDAAKSSVLSTEWRNLWNYLPTLLFDDREIQLPSVSRILTRHRGPLKEFSLSLSLSLSHSLNNLFIIDKILLLLAPQAITSLTVDFRDCDGYIQRLHQMPILSAISSFSQLETLRLSWCKVYPAPVLFDNLTVLQLKRVVFPQAQWKFVCPLLTTLTLDGCISICSNYVGPAIVMIEEAPKLTYFYLAGDFSSLQFNSATPLLKQVVIRKTWLTWIVEWDLLKPNGALATVESLSIAGSFYEYLAADQYVECNNKPWKKLRHLTLGDVRLRAKCHAGTVLHMINSSPNLQQLTIQMDNFYYAVETKNSKDDKALEIMKSGGVDADAGSGFELLKRIEVKEVRGSDDELSLISWLLNSSPALEQMKIRVCNEFISCNEVSQIVKSVDGFRRASSKAQITYTGLSSVRWTAFSRLAL